MTAINLKTMRNLHNDGSLVAGRSCTLTDCTFAQGAYHNILVEDGATVTGCTFDNAYRGSTNSSMMVFNENTPAGLGITVQNCTFSLDTYDSYIGGLTGHNNVAGSFGAITVDNCTFTNVDVAIQPDDCGTVTVTDCIVTGIRLGIRDSHALTWVIDSLTFSTGVAGARVLSIESASTVTGTDITASVTGGVSGGMIYVTAAATIDVTDSSFTITASGSRRGFYCTNAGADLTMNNNTYSDSFLQYYYLNPECTWTSDNNCFLVDFASTIIGATTYNTLADHQAGTGKDLASQEGGCS